MADFGQHLQTIEQVKKARRFQKFRDSIETTHETIESQSIATDSRVSEGDLWRKEPNGVSAPKRYQIIGALEKHTEGFRSEMMAKMGFVEGTGLGKVSQGIVAPPVAVRLPNLQGLGYQSHLRFGMFNKIYRWVPLRLYLMNYVI
ncbi:hypothetical protein Ddye_021845 [Dipteronia dyeriana]|uniref:G-patch domain-containing protein n=1 Tax=Dipteronia dyeriana TaxID=168575 RepID=A0AAD9WYD6_9ROSI|nr:hypothetical protein Ddye_021845 [Dipteronia dyeriana]